MKTVPIDIEEALYSYLTDKGYNCSGTPVPRDFDEKLPFIAIERTGGSIADRVINTHRVSLDVYCKTWKEATDLTAELCGIILDLENKELSGVPVYSATVDTIGYNNSDPDYPTLARVTQDYLLVTRTKEI